MQPEYKPLFKTPKYTGVTLSLLSIFVLASMLVVWEKMPQVDPGNGSKDLSVWAEDSLQTSLKLAQAAYRKETGQSLLIQFFPAPKNSSDFERLVQSDADLIIFTDTNDSSLDSLKVRTEESIPLAYHRIQPDSKNELGKCPVTAFISKRTMQPTKSIRFARFLAAPSRGQYYFAQGNWIGVNGDFWAFNPEIKVLCSPRLQSLVSAKLPLFNRREGAVGEAEFKDFPEIESVLQVLAQSEGKKYLPDLVVCEKFVNLDPDLYKRQLTIHESFSSYVLSSGRYKQLCKRLAFNLSTPLQLP
jgi:hypothetical protein